MTNTAQEPVRVEDWTDRRIAMLLSECALEIETYARDRYFADLPDGVHPTEKPGFVEDVGLAHRARKAAARLRARQREEGDPLVPGLCPHCSGLMGHYGNCPHARQREGEREPTCPKCGAVDASTRWMPVCDAVSRGYKKCRNLDEHLHRTCRNCRYEWDDPVLDTEPPAEREPRDDEWPNEPYERQVP